MDDLLIRGATLYDGSGNDPLRADLAVRDGRIHAIAPTQPVQARKVVDAEGLALMPGIIDSHTHFDAQLTWDAMARPSPTLGVNTAVIGNCGFTIAPCRPQDRELTMRNLTQVEGMSLEVLQRGIDWGFETFAEYLAQLRQRGVGVNVAAYVGHSSLRTWVMGADANRREASADEIAQMAAQSAWPARPVRRTTARAARRCRRAWPATPSTWRWSRRWARAGAASTW